MLNPFGISVCKHFMIVNLAFLKIGTILAGMLFYKFVVIHRFDSLSVVIQFKRKRLSDFPMYCFCQHMQSTHRLTYI